MIKAWLLDADYVTINGKAVVRLWCKKDEDVFVAYDKNFQPYFYVLKNGLKIEDIKNAKVERKNEVISPLNVEEVKVGQTLLILEAMKMENEVVSPKDGVVKEIKVKEGMRVETGDALVVIE